MSKTLRAELELHEAIEVVLNTRDFCGDEQEALIEWQAENRQLSSEEILAVFRAVNAEWGELQAKAGVKRPLTVQERRKAYRDLEG